MTLHLSADRKIENLRGYHPDLVAQLRTSLATGAPATPDPCRQAFYDVRSGGRVFFIHISPVSGNIMLLATWREEREQPQTSEGIVPEVRKTTACAVCAA
jgi:hypothetical protein